jgi:uncharacterized protein
VISGDAVLDELVAGLAQIHAPERIYLFGSAARGEAGPDSPYDFMIVVPDSTPVETRDPGLAYRALWRFGAALDPLVWSRSEFDSRLHLKASLPATIHREGKFLYAA